MKLRLKLIEKKTIYILYCILILLIAYLFDRFLQMLLFILLFDFIQNCFFKRFHSDTIYDNPILAVKMCKLITIVIEIIYMIFCKELDVSLYSNLFVIFSISLTSCIIELSLEYVVIKVDCLKNKNKLLFLCERAKLTQNATDRMVLKYIEHKTYQEIADLECVDIDTIKKSINRSRKKIFRNQD